MAKILIVDDAIFMRATIKKILEENGHSVIGEGATGVEAVQKYRTLNPDLVLMDITMPEMDGIDALREIRKINPKARTVICSAIGQKGKVVEAIEAGATGFIVKPFESVNLVNAVEQALKASI